MVHCTDVYEPTYSTYIYFGEDSRATLCDLPVYIGSVPTEHLDSLPDKLKASLTRICNEGIDMERMEMIINRDERQVSDCRESWRLGLTARIAPQQAGSLEGRNVLGQCDRRLLVWCGGRF